MKRFVKMKDCFSRNKVCESLRTLLLKSFSRSRILRSTLASVVIWVRITNFFNKHKTGLIKLDQSSLPAQVRNRLYQLSWDDWALIVGAGLGILRKVDFEITLIDEASQITEPCALIPLVKGITRAVIVGDQWVQLIVILFRVTDSPNPSQCATSPNCKEHGKSLGIRCVSPRKTLHYIGC